jgi:hypothetical protein
MARNRLQAGLVKETLLQYTISGRGIRDTLPFMGPFMLSSVPHDFAELMVYFQGNNLVDQLPSDCWLKAAVKQEVLDAVVGACAGAAGVLISMPADCIKTKVVTNHSAPSTWPVSAAGRAAESIHRAWLTTAKHTATEQGPRGFYAGLLPRLVDEVPGSMLHWTFAEGCTRWLERLC